MLIVWERKKVINLHSIESIELSGSIIQIHLHDITIDLEFTTKADAENGFQKIYLSTYEPYIELQPKMIKDDFKKSSHFE